MIAYLRGKIKYIATNWIILDVSGVGYKIQMKIAPTLSKVGVPTKTSGKIGEQRELYIYHHIREDRSELYGFNEIEDLQMFELLLSVSGVGPKIAFNILSQTTRAKLQGAIINGDATLFTTISGVGKKMAMKILLELKSKTPDNLMDIGNLSESSEELLEAMQSLGYKKQEIYPMLAKLPVDIESTEAKIKWLLKKTKR